MTPAEFERANTWLIEIVDVLVEGVQWRQEGDERRALNHGGLTINTRKGCWHSHSSGKGGWEALSLVQFLKGCDNAAATEWVRVFLGSHEGTGSIVAGADGADDARVIEAVELTHETIGKLIDPIGTPAEAYLRSRGLTGSIPDFVKFLPNARCGEGAIAALLKAHDRVIGVQIGFLDPDGHKSTVTPYRRRFGLEQAPGAVFELPLPAGAVDSAMPLWIGEGLEDAMALAELGRSVHIIGLPGAGALKHLVVKKGEKILVCRDGDKTASAADSALIAGVDHLLLGGAEVRVTDTPPGQDANSILQSGGTAALAELIDQAEPAALSRDGEITRLSRLDPLDYENARAAAAEQLGIRVSVLDQQVSKRRPRKHQAADEEEDTAGLGRAIALPLVDPWPEPVDGEPLLDNIAAAIQNYLIIDRHQATATALWVVFSHTFDAFDVAPKLVVRSAQKRSGKTRGLELLVRLVGKPLLVASISAPSLLRLIERHAPSLLLDELDTLLKGGAEMAEALRGLLNSGFNRAGATFIKGVSLPGGGWEPRAFSTWCPQVLAGIGKLPDTVADRSIQIVMKRKKRTESVRRLRLRDGGELHQIARRAARWAADHMIELGAADPAMPNQLNDRAADAWSPLLAIAEATGDAWARRARAAAIELSGDGDEDTQEVELLADIREVFEAKRAAAQTETELKLSDRIASQELLTFLLNQEDRPWAEINNGRPLTKNGLAYRLKPFGLTPMTIQLGVGRDAPSAKGYFRRTFEDAFARYLSTPPVDPPYSTVRPSDSAETQGFQADSETSDMSMSDGLKTPGNPSKTAKSDGLTVQKGGKEGGDGKVSEEPPPNGADVRPNGHDAQAAPAALDDEIRAYAAANPKRKTETIAKRFGQPRAYVATLLGRDQ